MQADTSSASRVRIFNLVNRPEIVGRAQLSTSKLGLTAVIIMRSET